MMSDYIEDDENPDMKCGDIGVWELEGGWRRLVGRGDYISVAGDPTEWMSARPVIDGDYIKVAGDPTEWISARPVIDDED